VFINEHIIFTLTRALDRFRNIITTNKTFVPPEDVHFQCHFQPPINDMHRIQLACNMHLKSVTRWNCRPYEVRKTTKISVFMSESYCKFVQEDVSSMLDMFMLSVQFRRLSFKLLHPIHNALTVVVRVVMSSPIAVKLETNSKEHAQISLALLYSPTLCFNYENNYRWRD